jgi:hypothetical protein
MLLTAGVDDGDSGAYRTCTDLERTVALDQRGKPNFNPRHIGDRVKGSRFAIKRDAEITGTNRRAGFRGCSHDTVYLLSEVA